MYTSSIFPYLLLVGTPIVAGRLLGLAARKGASSPSSILRVGRILIWLWLGMCLFALAPMRVSAALSGAKPSHQAATLIVTITTLGMLGYGLFAAMLERLRLEAFTRKSWDPELALAAGGHFATAEKTRRTLENRFREQVPGVALRFAKNIQLPFTYGRWIFAPVWLATLGSPAPLELLLLHEFHHVARGHNGIHRRYAWLGRFLPILKPILHALRIAMETDSDRRTYSDLAHSPSKQTDYIELLKSIVGPSYATETPLQLGHDPHDIERRISLMTGPISRDPRPMVLAMGTAVVSALAFAFVGGGTLYSAFRSYLPYPVQGAVVRSILPYTRSEGLPGLGGIAPNGIRVNTLDADPSKVAMRISFPSEASTYWPKPSGDLPTIQVEFEYEVLESVQHPSAIPGGCALEQWTAWFTKPVESGPPISNYHEAISNDCDFMELPRSKGRHKIELRVLTGQTSLPRVSNRFHARVYPDTNSTTPDLDLWIPGGIVARITALKATSTRAMKPPFEIKAEKFVAWQRAIQFRDAAPNFTWGSYSEEVHR